MLMKGVNSMLIKSEVNNFIIDLIIVVTVVVTAVVSNWQLIKSFPIRTSIIKTAKNLVGMDDLIITNGLTIIYLYIYIFIYLYLYIYIFIYLYIYIFICI